MPVLSSAPPPPPLVTSHVIQTTTTTSSSSCSDKSRKRRLCHHELNGGVVVEEEEEVMVDTMNDEESPLLSSSSSCAVQGGDVDTPVAKRQRLIATNGRSIDQNGGPITKRVEKPFAMIKARLLKRQLAIPLRVRRGFADKLPRLTHVPDMRQRQYELFAEMRQTFALSRSQRRRARLYRYRSLAAGSKRYHIHQSKIHGRPQPADKAAAAATAAAAPPPVDLIGNPLRGVHYYAHHEDSYNNHSTPIRDIITFKANLFQPEQVDESIFDLALQQLQQQQQQQREKDELPQL